MSSSITTKNQNSSLAKKVDLNQVLLTELMMSARHSHDDDDVREVYKQVSPGAVFVLQDRGELTKKIIAQNSKSSF